MVTVVVAMFNAFLYATGFLKFWSQAFLGDRYGSRLLPTRVPVTEYRSLRRLASWMDLSDFAIVDKWYVVDTNSVPAVYRLQPITDLLPFYHDTDPKNRIIRKQVWDFIQGNSKK